MFRRLQPVAHKEEDVVFPVDLEKLGLFINENDQLRQIEKPDVRFEYYKYKLERLNERRRESLNECIRRIVRSRLEGLGMKIQMLPLDEDDASGRKVPVFISDDLATNKKKVLVIVPDSAYDFGIWSYRVLEDETIEKGSMVSTVKMAQAAGFSVVIANVSQNIWSPYHDPPRAVTYTSWKATTKKTPNIDEFRNRVPHNETAGAHVRYVMDKIVGRIAPTEANVFMLTAGFGAMGSVEYFNKNYASWKERLQAITFCETPHAAAELVNEDFREFVLERCRCYIIYAHAKGDYIQDRRYGCHTFSSAEMFTDCVTPAVQDLIFDYFKLVEEDPDMANPQLMSAADFIEVEPEIKQAADNATGDGEWISPEDPGPWKVDEDTNGKTNGADKATENGVRDTAANSTEKENAKEA